MAITNINFKANVQENGKDILKQKGRIVIGLEGTHTLDEADILLLPPSVADYGPDHTNSQLNHSTVQYYLNQESINEVVFLTARYSIGVLGDIIEVPRNKRLYGNGSTIESYVIGSIMDQQSLPSIRLNSNSLITGFDMSWFSIVVSAGASNCVVDKCATNLVITDVRSPLYTLIIEGDFCQVSNCYLERINIKGKYNIVEKNGLSQGVYLTDQAANNKLLSNTISANGDGAEFSFEEQLFLESGANCNYIISNDFIECPGMPAIINGSNNWIENNNYPLELIVGGGVDDKGNNNKYFNNNFDIGGSGASSSLKVGNTSVSEDKLKQLNETAPNKSYTLSWTNSVDEPGGAGWWLSADIDKNRLYVGNFVYLKDGYANHSVDFLVRFAFDMNGTACEFILNGKVEELYCDFVQGYLKVSDDVKTLIGDSAPTLTLTSIL